ncbi:MAG: hypothetical protein K8H88_01785, partial [Sandaracinaceae bacterium]|nr:hypothetical protein [Sandaracinaceae bacterium]
AEHTVPVRVVVAEASVRYVRGSAELAAPTSRSPRASSATGLPVGASVTSGGGSPPIAIASAFHTSTRESPSP